MIHDVGVARSSAVPRPLVQHATVPLRLIIQRDAEANTFVRFTEAGLHD